MAHKVGIETGNVGIILLTINDISVGENGGNYRRSDVQLIQFFLRQFYKQQQYIRQISGIDAIKIDGICGPKTKKGILWFQKAQASTGRSIAVDGIVDVLRGFGVSSISHTIYTIVHMNNYFQSQGEGKEHYQNLENHEDVIAYAPELQAELAKQKF